MFAFFVLDLFLQILSKNVFGILILPQWAFTCLKLTIERLEQGVKYVQS